MEDNQELLKKIIQEEKNTNVCIMTAEGMKKIPINNFINQSAESILYDLNRDKSTTITIAKTAKGKRWINDYATAVVIENLKKEYDKLSNKYDLLEEKYNELLHDTHTVEDVKSKEVKHTNSLEPITNIHLRTDGISEEELFRI